MLPCNHIKGSRGWLVPLEECFRALTQSETFFIFQYLVKSAAVLKPISETTSPITILD